MSQQRDLRVAAARPNLAGKLARFSRLRFGIRIGSRRLRGGRSPRSRPLLPGLRLLLSRRSSGRFHGFGVRLDDRDDRQDAPFAGHFLVESGAGKLSEVDGGDRRRLRPVAGRQFRLLGAGRDAASAGGAHRHLAQPSLQHFRYVRQLFHLQFIFPTF